MEVASQKIVEPETVPAGDASAQAPKTGALASLTRRGFIGAASMGAATVGVLGSVPGMSLLSNGSAEVDTGEVPAAAVAEPLVAQVRDFSTGEISIMSGMREVIIRDPQIVARLLKSLIP
jgi:hypothetical protein